MNIVFWAMVAGSLVLLWFAVSPLFKYMGSDFKGLFDRAMDALTEDESEDE